MSVKVVFNVKVCWQGSIAINVMLHTKLEETYRN